MSFISISGIALLRASRPNFLILSLLCAWPGDDNPADGYDRWESERSKASSVGQGN